MAEPFLERNVHPTVICRGYTRALEEAVKIIDEFAFPVDINDRKQMMNIVNSCLGTKFTTRFGDLMAVSDSTRNGFSASWLERAHCASLSSPEKRFGRS